MHKNMSQEIMLDVARETLEDATFIFSEPQPWSEQESGGEDCLEAKLPFRVEGESFVLLMSAPSAVAEEVTANLLGVDPGTDEVIEKRSDGFGELLNIVCGALLDAWFPNDTAVYDLATPQVEEVGAQKHNETMGRAVLSGVLVTEEDAHVDVGVIPGE